MGPYSLKELQRLAAAGQIQPSDVILEDRDGAGVPAGAYPGLFGSPPTARRSAPRGRLGEVPPALAAGKPAGFSARVMAVVVDSVLLGSLTAGFFSIYIPIVHGTTPPPYDPVLHVSGFVIGALYSGEFESVFQATPGKMVFGMKIVGLRGEKLSGLRAGIRGAAKSGSFVFLGGLPMLVALTRPDRRTLHDLVSGSVVVQNPFGRY